MPDKDETIEEIVSGSSTTRPENNEDNSIPEVINPFEKGHAGLSPEAVDGIEQFKEAQTERD